MHDRKLEHRPPPNREQARSVSKATILTLVSRRILGSMVVIAAFAALLFIVNDIVIGAQRTQFLHEQFSDSDTADVKAVRAWMTIRFVGVSYGVPVSFLYDQLSIPMEQVENFETLGKLNSRYGFGRSAHGDYPAIVDQVQAAILAYRADPVAPGLAQIQAWMNIRYIAHSTGIPESYLLERVDISSPGAAMQTLTDLNVASEYPGGVEGLVAALQQALSEYNPPNAVIVTQ